MIGTGSEGQVNYAMFSLHLKCRMEVFLLLLRVWNSPFFVEREDWKPPSIIVNQKIRQAKKKGV